MNALKVAKPLPHHKRHMCWCIPCRTFANVPGWLARRKWMSVQRRMWIISGRPMNLSKILRQRLIKMRRAREAERAEGGQS